MAKSKAHSLGKRIASTGNALVVAVVVVVIRKESGLVLLNRFQFLSTYQQAFCGVLELEFSYVSNGALSCKKSQGLVSALEY